MTSRLPVKRATSAFILALLEKPLAMLLLLLAFGAGIALDPGVATAAAAAAALVGAVLTLSHADATARRTRTAEYRARWEHPELLDARIAATDFLTLHGVGEEARWKEWRRWVKRSKETRKRLQIMTILNFWEEVAGAYNQDLLDHAWFHTDLAWLLEHNWERAGWFIRKFRAEDENAMFFSEWQIAVESVEGDLRRQEEAGRDRARRLGEKGDLLYVDQGPIED